MLIFETLLGEIMKVPYLTPILVLIETGYIISNNAIYIWAGVFVYIDCVIKVYGT